MDTEITAMQADLPDSQVAQEFEHLDLITTPVVDEKGILVGRITIDDVVDVIRDEADHSVLTMAGLDEEDDMFAPVIQTAKRRWIWLSVNLVTAFIAAIVLSFFEPTLAQVVALAILFPVIMSMGGIAGTQTLTLVIRGMATGQVNKSNAGAIFRKEVAVGILNGIVFAIIVASIAAWWYSDLKLGAVMAAAMIINLLAGAVAGAIIPLSLKKIHIDPALAGGVDLNTVTDVVGILAFVGLASLVLTQ
jgi:magnesium transporter